MGSATPLTVAVMDALPSSPPREVWVMGWSSCWTYSRMNTFLSGERQVKGPTCNLFTRLTRASGWSVFTCHILWQCMGVCVRVLGLCVYPACLTHKIPLSVWIHCRSHFSPSFRLIPPSASRCRWDIVWSRGQSPDPQSGRALLHWPAGLRSGAGVPDVRVLSGTAGTAIEFWSSIFMNVTFTNVTLSIFLQTGDKSEFGLLVLFLNRLYSFFYDNYPDFDSHVAFLRIIYFY